jgi:ParB-like chromosome segregation protein Spo0J
MGAETTQAEDTTKTPRRDFSTDKAKFVEYEFHPLAKIFPLLGKKEAEELKKDIEANGQREPVAIYQRQILDGRNRYLACKALGKPATTKDLPADTDIVAYVTGANLKRRHMTAAQRGMAAAKLANLKLGSNQHNSEGLSAERASEVCGASIATTNRCKAVLANGIDELVQLVEEDKLPASVAEKAAALSKEEQTALVEKGVTAIKKRFPTKTPAASTPPSTAASDKIDGEENAYIDALKRLKPAKFENAEAAVSNLVRRLQDLDFLTDYKPKKD